MEAKPEKVDTLKGKVASWRKKKYILSPHPSGIAAKNQWM